MKKKLGQLETQFFAYVQMRKLKTVRTGELVHSLRISAKQERELFSRLARAGVIARVWRGVYLVPPRLPLGGKWSPSDWLALNTLMEVLKGRYQICGPNAFNWFNFDEQVPNRVYAYNNRISGDRRIGAVTLALIEVADKRLGDTQTMKSITVAEDRELKLDDSEAFQEAVYASRARTLLDAVYDWARFDSLPRGYGWIRRELKAKRVSATELVKLTVKYGDVGTIRRMGVLLEREGVREALLKKLERKLKPTTSLIPWIPCRPKRGTVNRRWGVVENDKG